MRPVHRLSVALTSIALAAALFSPPPIRASAQTANSASRATIVVIIGNQTGITEMSNALLRRVFRGDPTELNGRRLTPFNYAVESPLRRHFDLNALGMSTGEVGRYWIDRRIRGQGLPPRTVPSQAMARAVVARLPGAIAYITASELDPAVHAVNIDGKRYSDRDYPLQGAPQ